MRESVKSIIHRIEGLQQESDIEVSSIEKRHCTKSGMARRLPQQPQSRRLSTFPSGPEQKPQLSKLNEDMEKRGKCEGRQVSSEGTGEHVGQALETNSPSTQIRPQRQVPGPFNISMSKITQGDNMDSAGGQDRIRERRPVSSEVVNEAHVNAMIGFGTHGLLKGKGKQKQEREFHSIEKREDSSAESNPHHRIKSGSQNKAIHDRASFAGDSGLYMHSKCYLVRADKSSSQLGRSVRLLRPDYYRPRGSPPVSPPQNANIQHKPLSPQPEDFYRLAMINNGLKRISVDQSEISIVEQERFEDNDSLTPTPLLGSANQLRDNAHGCKTEQAYYIPTGAIPQQHQDQPVRRPLIRSSGVSKSSDKLSSIDVSSGTEWRPPTDCHRSATAFSYMLPTTPSPFSTPYAISNECTFPTHRSNEPPSHCVNGSTLGFEEMKQVWDQQNTRLHLSKSITEIQQSYDRLQTQILNFLDRHDQVEEQHQHNLVQATEQASANTSWGLTPEELYNSPQWQEQRRKKKCNWWKRVFCKCCALTTPKTTSKPWVPASAITSTPSSRLDCSQASIGPNGARPNGALKSGEKHRLSGEKTTKRTSTNDETTDQKHWKRGPRVDQEPKKRGKLTKKRPTAP